MPKSDQNKIAYSLRQNYLNNENNIFNNTTRPGTVGTYEKKFIKINFYDNALTNNLKHEYSSPHILFLPSADTLNNNSNSTKDNKSKNFALVTNNIKNCIQNNNDCNNKLLNKNI